MQSAPDAWLLPCLPAVLAHTAAISLSLQPVVQPGSKVPSSQRQPSHPRPCLPANCLPQVGAPAALDGVVAQQLGHQLAAAAAAAAACRCTLLAIAAHQSASCLLFSNTHAERRWLPLTTSPPSCAG